VGDDAGRLISNLKFRIFNAELTKRANREPRPMRESSPAICVQRIAKNGRLPGRRWKDTGGHDFFGQNEAGLARAHRFRLQHFAQGEMCAAFKQTGQVSPAARQSAPQTESDLRRYCIRPNRRGDLLLDFGRSGFSLRHCEIHRVHRRAGLAAAGDVPVVRAHQLHVRV
jgi:hypothetical protein